MNLSSLLWLVGPPVKASPPELVEEIRQTYPRDRDTGMTRVAPWYGCEITYCYMARCADGSLYCGITSDLQRRIEIHNAGKGSKYTRGRLPVTLVYNERLRTRSEALRREIEIKRLPKAAKERLVGGK